MQWTWVQDFVIKTNIWQGAYEDTVEDSEAKYSKRKWPNYLSQDQHWGNLTMTQLTFNCYTVIPELVVAGPGGWKPQTDGDKRA